MTCESWSRTLGSAGGAFLPAAVEADDLRAEFGYDDGRLTCIVAVGGSGVGATLIRRILEAYPIDKAGPARDDWLWHGAMSMYDKAGFVEVAGRRAERPVVRLKLA